MSFSGGFNNNNNNNNVSNNNNNGSMGKCGDSYCSSCMHSSRDSSSCPSGGGGTNNNNAGGGGCYNVGGGLPTIQVTAKVLFGSVSAISALNAERKKKTWILMCLNSFRGVRGQFLHTSHFLNFLVRLSHAKWRPPNSKSAVQSITESPTQLRSHRKKERHHSCCSSDKMKNFLEILLNMKTHKLAAAAAAAT